MTDAQNFNQDPTEIAENPNPNKSKEEKLKDISGVEKAAIQPPTPQVEPFMAMDAKDDEQILAEIEGKGALVADDWVYSFQQEGKEITGLSWKGTQNAAYYFRRKGMLDLTVSDLSVVIDPTDNEYVLCRVRCEDKINGGSIYGVKRQYLKIKKRDGSIVPNPFWYEQGVSKAQRNAIQAMMPADWVAKIIKKYIDDGKVKKIAPSNQTYNRTTSLGTQPAAANNPKVYWARYYAIQNIDDANKLLADVQKAQLPTNISFAIINKIKEKLSSITGTPAPSPSQEAVPTPEDIPF